MNIFFSTWSKNHARGAKCSQKITICSNCDFFEEWQMCNQFGQTYRDSSIRSNRFCNRPQFATSEVSIDKSQFREGHTLQLYNLICYVSIILLQIMLYFRYECTKGRCEIEIHRNFHVRSDRLSSKIHL